jgi:hypothetical protein
LEGKINILSRNIIRYGEITDTNPDRDLSKIMNGMWGFHFLENNVRTSAFKLFNNVLGTNKRVSKFVPGHSPLCTFCTLARDPDLEEESINHLFQDCPSAEPVILEKTNWMGRNVDNNITRRDYLCRKKFNTVNKDLVWNVFVLILKFNIWDCKLKFKIPVSEHIKQNIIDCFQIYCTLKGQ